jgi:hypothetical protein
MKSRAIAPDVTGLVARSCPSWLRLLLVVGAIACDEGEVNFTTKLASDFAPARQTVSVLGLYKDGLMSSEGWGAVAPYLAPALGGGRCEIGYDALVWSNAPLAEAIDEFARADGPTDDLLGRLSPAARGDLLLVVTFAGKLPQKAMADGGAFGEPVPSPGAGTRGNYGMGGGGSMRGRPRPEPVQDTNAVDISASLYSVRQRRSVALVALRYSGATLDDALTKFGAKLAQTLPRMTCVGWNWDVTIDPDRIRNDIDK